MRSQIQFMILFMAVGLWPSHEFSNEPTHAVEPIQQPPLSTVDPSVVAPLWELYSESAYRVTEQYFYRDRFFTNSFVEASFSLSGYMKIRARDHRDIPLLARYLRATNISGQVLFASAVFERGEYIGRRNYGFFYSSSTGIFSADNEETAQILRDDMILNLGRLYPAIIENIDVLEANADIDP